MTIVHIVYGLGMGGIESMLVNISHYQAKAGHSVHVVVINDIFDQSLVDRLDPSVKLHKIGRKVGSKNPWPILKMNLCLMDIHPDVIHLHYASISKYIFIPSYKKILCNTLHSTCNSKNTVGIRQAGPIFAISEAVKNDVFEKYGLESKVVVNGIEAHDFSQKEPCVSPRSCFKIVQIGRLLHEVKGQDILIKAVSNVVSRGISVELTFIGEGPSEYFLSELVERLGIVDKVRFLGNKSQEYVGAHLKDYDLFVQPSRQEGFGLTVAEAMAAKVPVLVSDIDGPLEVIGYGKYGFSFNRESVADCEEKIIGIIKNYPSDESLMMARDYVVKKYNVESTANQYLSIYNSSVKIL